MIHGCALAIGQRNVDLGALDLRFHHLLAAAEGTNEMAGDRAIAARLHLDRCQLAGAGVVDLPDQRPAVILHPPAYLEGGSTDDAAFPVGHPIDAGFAIRPHRFAKDERLRLG